MKGTARVFRLGCLFLCAAAGAGAAPSPAAAEQAAETQPPAWTLGADLRVRQELMDNIPGHPGDPLSHCPAPSGKNLNWLRVRPRVWTRFESDDCGLYLRLADEMREHFVENGTPRGKRSYNPPDEVIVDNLYLDLRGLLNGRLSLRIGRQDFLDAGRPAFGSGRLLMDGTAYDGSRSAYFDAVRATWRVTDKTDLDALAIYNRGENLLRLGRPTPSPRAANAIDPRDSAEMDEYGGGLYLRSRALGDGLPFELYYLFKRENSRRLLGARRPGRRTHTIGGRLLPEITETLSAEFEGAVQSGQKDGGASTAGALAFAGLTYRPAAACFGGARPFLKASCHYLSGDRRRGGAGDRDTAWDPLWARWPQDSEMLVYGPLYGLGYWSNLLFPSAGGGLDIAAHHRLNLYAGPMFAPAKDGLGGGDGPYRGLLAVLRYDFPIWKNRGAGGIGEVFGHVMAEGFRPGGYFESDRTAYFLRWEITARF